MKQELDIGILHILHVFYLYQLLYCIYYISQIIFDTGTRSWVQLHISR